MMRLHVPHVHMPTWHGMSEGMSHMFHDRRFWAIVSAIALIAFLLMLAILTKGGAPQEGPMTFYNLGYPYIP